jgi:hypothetical protein
MAASSSSQVRAESDIVIIRKILIVEADSSVFHELTESFGAFGHCQIASKKRKSDSRRELGIESERSLIFVLPRSVLFIRQQSRGQRDYQSYASRGQRSHPAVTCQLEQQHLHKERRKGELRGDVLISTCQTLTDKSLPEAVSITC